MSSRGDDRDAQEPSDSQEPTPKQRAYANALTARAMAALTKHALSRAGQRMTALKRPEPMATYVQDTVFVLFRIVHEEAGTELFARILERIGNLTSDVTTPEGWPAVAAQQSRSDKN